MRDAADHLDFASQLQNAVPTDWSVIASITQPLIVAPHLDEKRANLAKAITLMNALVIKPGQTLSIWRCLGPPTACRGWASGRTIINDVMTTDPGGGLCQFSSLIYHLGLLARLDVRERHHHSRDIHATDATRFTPLGLDATLVYGFKDLRLRNDGAGDLVVTFQLTQTSLTGQVSAIAPTTPRRLHLLRQDNAQSRTVIVSCIEADGTLKRISANHYLL